MSTYRDYLWLGKQYEFWTGNGYCATLIRNATPEQVLEALDAGPRRPTAYGLNDVGLEDVNFEILKLVEFPKSQVIAVTAVGDGWTLMIQQNSGYVGIDAQLMAPIIAGHEVISHYTSVNADGRFIWWRDGREQISFDTLLPGHDLLDSTRWEPDVYAHIMNLINQVGGIEFDYDGTRTESHHVQGAFALAERLTGVRITHNILDEAPYIVAIAPTLPVGPRPSHDKPLATTGMPGQPTTWGEIIQLHQQSLEETIHGVFVKTEHQEYGNVVQLEFWHRPFQSWRLHDDQGVFFVQNKRQEVWFRDSAGTLQYEGGGMLPAWPADLISIFREYDAPLNTLLAPDTAGTAVTVAGRPAWEFSPPPHWNAIPARLAFDADTGVALRWASEHWTNELTTVEVGPDLPDELFEGPRQPPSTIP